jgi:hypothetical protein
LRGCVRFLRQYAANCRRILHHHHRRPRCWAVRRRGLSTHPRSTAAGLAVARKRCAGRGDVGPLVSSILLSASGRLDSLEGESSRPLDSYSPSSLPPRAPLFVLNRSCPLANTHTHVRVFISNSSPPRCVAASQQATNSTSVAADLLLRTVRSWIPADLVINAQLRRQRLKLDICHRYTARASHHAFPTPGLAICCLISFSRSSSSHSFASTSCTVRGNLPLGIPGL